MPEIKQKNGTAQRQIPQQAPLPASFDLDHQIRILITDAIKRSPKKRQQIAEEMTNLLGRSVTAQMLMDYTAESRKQYHFPAAWIPAFCEVTADFRLVDCLNEKIGLRVVTQEEEMFIELGRRAAVQAIATKDLQVVLADVIAAGGTVPK